MLERRLVVTKMLPFQPNMLRETFIVSSCTIGFLTQIFKTPTHPEGTVSLVSGFGRTVSLVSSNLLSMLCFYNSCALGGLYHWCRALVIFLIVNKRAFMDCIIGVGRSFASLSLTWRRHQTLKTMISCAILDVEYYYSFFFSFFCCASAEKPFPYATTRIETSVKHVHHRRPD